MVHHINKTNMMHYNSVTLLPIVLLKCFSILHCGKLCLHIVVHKLQ